jgi:hypothetical protein
MVSALHSSDLRELLRSPGARRELRRLVASRNAGGLAALDTQAMRLSFPSRLQIRLRSGRTLEIEGEQPGSCGRPLEEQREVVEEKCRLVGLDSNLDTSLSRLAKSR